SSRPRDYTPTLTKFDEGQRELAQKVSALSAHPALAMRPADYERAVLESGQTIMSKATVEVQEAARRMKEATTACTQMIGTVRTQDRQFKWIAWSAGVALIVGLVVSPWLIGGFFPAAARISVAAFLMGPDRWADGTQLLADAQPQLWQEYEQMHAWGVKNRDAFDALKACEAEAAKLHKDQRCTVEIVAPKAPRTS
ncbi:MAG: DUF6118 family protein, partial [Acetobacteraceae bacterium]